MTRQERARKIYAKLTKLYPVSKTALQYKTNWQLLVAIMLSAQTTDKKVNEVTRKLFKKYRKPADFATATVAEVAGLIREVNYYKTKAKHIVAAARELVDNYAGRVPFSISELTALPGVGRKTANVLIGNATGKAVGIAVDTHVKRLVALFDLVDERKNTDKMEQELMKLFPQSQWHLITNRFIDYGREYCPARCRHADCPLRSYIHEKKDKR